MKRTSFARWPCSIARTVNLIGDWWTPLVLREAFYGTTRFEGMQQSLGIGRNVLTQRLQRLVREGVLQRCRYQEHPQRFEYRLSEKGRDLFQVLMVMMGWGDRWLQRGRGVPIQLRHVSCGHIVRPEVMCAECREPLRIDSVRAELGPGFPARLAMHPRVQARFGRPARRRAEARSGGGAT